MHLDQLQLHNEGERREYRTSIPRRVECIDEYQMERMDSKSFKSRNRFEDQDQVGNGSLETWIVEDVIADEIRQRIRKE